MVRKGTPLPSVSPALRGHAWSREEIDVALDAYVALLSAQLTGAAMVKRDVVREVAASLRNRTRGSIEYKLENVSAILYEEGLPWVEGYAPARNYQQALRAAVLDRLDGPAEERRRLEALATASPGIGTVTLAAAHLEVPPPAGRTRRTASSRVRAAETIWRGAQRDAANRRLGRDGEEWICVVEKQRLTDAGRPDLADLVEWVSQSQGDGLGYDVLSFTPAGVERWIEVKTTNAGQSAPFLLTRRELDVWRTNVDQYQLVRVFDFSGLRRFYRLAGSPDAILLLDPVLWDARPQ